MHDEVSNIKKCLYYCRQFTTFLFSHIGLVGLVVGYAMLGAFVFEALEANNERNKKIEMKLRRYRLVTDLWDKTSGLTLLDKDNWTDMATETLRFYERDVVHAVRREGFDGTEEDELQWTFSGALLFSIIVITTIGYGNVAPKTPWGKVTTVTYAILGIPLMLLCMSNIGDAMAQSFKFIYWKVCCFFCTRAKKKQQQRQMQQRRMRSIRRHLRYSTRGRPGGSMRMRREPGATAIDDMTFDSGSRSSLRSYCPDPSFGDDEGGYPGRKGGSVRSTDGPVVDATLRYSHKGHILYSAAEQIEATKVPIISNKYIMQDHKDLRVDLLSSGKYPGATPNESRQGSYRQQRPLGRSQSHRSSKKSGAVLDDFDDFYEDDDMPSWYESDEDLEQAKKRVTVPIPLCLALVTGYICGGAVLFSFWEGWDFLDSSYFCFVTLTTIGFGDLVPGKSVVTDDSQVTLALCALYLLFGMALLAMSFNLVQEQVTSTVKSIGKSIGIITDDEDEEE